ncbi:26.5 kDa heat shock protein, mitochondrial isoform X1 [Cucurbita moschata]|uniref:26.5 kDa heat shock protein, mitochondrial isoform X1 n=2 Tax=Cucurbita moschata TaxID=3662 RepID=A0A6J1GVM4_CUCMO|nr:26.5 kDa heat shock protein, mitochondrial isoform X1 [Cucurbita moschata]
MVYLRNNWKLYETCTGQDRHMFSPWTSTCQKLQRHFWTHLSDSPPSPHVFIISSSATIFTPKHITNRAHSTSLFEYSFPMALTRLALKNLQQRALVSSSADALLHRQTEALIRRFCDQSSEGNPKEVAINNEDKNTKMVPKGEGKRWVLWKKNGREFDVGNSLMQAAENINRVLKSLNLRRPWWVSGGHVKEQEEWYKLRVEMPGIRKEDVKVRVEGRILSIRGEHSEEDEEEESGWRGGRYGYYESTVMLPEDAVADEIKAELKDGVLTITIPRTEMPPKDVKEITVV